MKSLAPGATLGVLGGGQLGLMFVASAQAMGYRTVVWDPSMDSPAGCAADLHIRQMFSDQAAAVQFASECDAVTLEFENVPVQLVEYLEYEGVPVAPSARALCVAQDRITEKTFIRDIGVHTTPFYPIRQVADIDDAFEHLSPPLILKTAQLGYDGKGQYIVDTAEQAISLFNGIGKVPCIVESRLQLSREISVILARSQQSECHFFPVTENMHRNGILHLSKVPASVDESIRMQVCESARRIADALAYHGVLAVEFFIAKDEITGNGEMLLVNEIAPRPHNSGHYTIDACSSSQFDQQVRMMCGLPALETQLLRPAVMVNLLGDLWEVDEPNWEILRENPLIELHLYGKNQARPGRKMGHFCLLGENLNADMEALQARAERYHQLLLADA
ncbi:MAG: 5-(carboxyamino)imidazole ribonucleotide synthase [Chromatiales bacterium]|nr:5-(carboxyamino)imidazole ribonucleotide synthase [Chromatiales bacterium]